MDEKQQEYIMDARPDEDELSSCCGAPVYTDYGICSDCLDHCR